MGKKVTHIKKVHHTFGIDDFTRHQGISKRYIVAVGDRCGMSQLLLVEIRHIECGTERQVRILLSINV